MSRFAFDPGADSLDRVRRTLQQANAILIPEIQQIRSDVQTPVPPATSFLQISVFTLGWEQVAALGGAWSFPDRITVGQIPARSGLYTVGYRLYQPFEASVTPYTLQANVLVGDVAGGDFYNASITATIGDDTSPPVDRFTQTAAKATTPIEPQTASGLARDNPSDVVVELGAAGAAVPSDYFAGSLDIVVVHGVLWPR